MDSLLGYSSPLYANGQVYVEAEGASTGGAHPAVNSYSGVAGVEIFSTAIASQGTSSGGPTVSGDMVFAEDGIFGGLFAFDASTGSRIWNIELPQRHGTSSPHAQASRPIGDCLERVRRDQPCVIAVQRVTICE